MSLLVMRMVSALLLGMVALGCDLPRDPEGTLHRVRGGVMRVGVCEAGPYVTDDGEPGGVEPDLLRGFAATLGAQVQWVRGPCDDLLHALTRYELDVVACGMRGDSPWTGRVGTTRPYAHDHGPRVIAVAPGENDFLMELDRHLEAFRRRAAE